ncbi:ubiquitin domain-containing protein DSK2 [Aspergillus clavatus NRRL 1]|uniref:Ubiquitin-like protein DskB, putative n=1 Tax=Aspergillus clavatus (strain ATCC 1007 / CBS 513.65 / DSM 816 / NCTC 3887 / NRRL 1 / QM 1276 / 107) TaxID=344612 RepID=A1CUI4_ASPCL|nr:ubiquitin-like protein DskB, putative [Aspergillus clavatus NRRL 1]EAW06971.1 ubiquitin-like protein DskB, putative [Aspergillus clavatus NRRL 1]
MADDTATTEDAPITFTIKSSNDAKYTFTLPLSTQVVELKRKLSAPEYADTPAERQRLIYSGRVLKDNETLATYKIKEGHTIHLVKSAASNQRQAGATQSASTSAPTGASTTPAPSGVPTNLAAGTGNNPLAGLTGARYAGFAQLPGAGMFGPDGGMGPPPDAESMLNMLENPQFQSTINEALQNPAMIDMMIQQNPMLRDMGPGVRQMMQSPEFRRMLTDPSSIRQMLQMQRAFGGGGAGGLGGGSAFPAPGVTNTTPEESRDTQNTNNTDAAGTGAPLFNPFAPPALGAGNPFAALFGGNGPNFGANPSSAATTAGGDQAQGTQGATGSAAAGSTTTGEGQNQQNLQNPFSFLMNPAMFGGAGPQGGQAGSNPFNPQQNPFLRDPALLSQMMQAMGAQGGEGGAAGANPLAALLGGGGFGTPPPQDNRPPEERYAEQLRQLNDMGFFEFERNVEALRRSGGSVQGAIEYLLSHPS